MTPSKAFLILILTAASAAAIDPSDPRVAKLRATAANDDVASEGPRVRRGLKKISAAKAAPKPTVVDCTKGESIQAAVDSGPDPLVIEVRGICSENVLISNHRDVTVRGTNPASDGIKGIDTATPALTIRYANIALIENLSVSDGAASGIFIDFTRNAEINKCRLTGNTLRGLGVAGASFVSGTELTISQNQQQGIRAQHGSFVSCLGCVLDNVGFAAVANSGALITLWDSVVTGRRGIQAFEGGSYVDIDCFTQISSFPCSLNVTGFAARAIGNATAAMFVAGDFTGQLSAFDRGEIQVIASRQLAAGQPGFGPTMNNFDGFAMLSVEPFEDEIGTPQESRVKGAFVHSFSRALLRGATTLDGPIQCSAAGDAWLDSTVVATPGSTVTGCEHASIP